MINVNKEMSRNMDFVDNASIYDANEEQITTFATFATYEDDPIDDFQISTNPTNNTSHHII